MGTRCGPQYVDIQVVALPGPRAAYADNFGAITAAVRNALGAVGDAAQHDHPGRRPGRRRAGVRPRRDDHGHLRRAVRHAEHPQPRRADLGPVQPRRRRRARRRPLGLVAGGLPARGVAQPRRRPVGRAALDAAARPVARPVRPLLPGRGRHVLRRGRRRAQPDGQPTARACPARSRRTTTAAATTTSTRRPRAGSYLATHWNTYDSAFLAPCGEIAPACGGGNLWVPEPPAASVRPDGRRQRRAAARR